MARLYFLYANLVLYSICYMMQQPALPFLTDKLGASTTQFARLQSVFNGAQAVGGLLSGPVLDAWGGKVLLLVSFVASALCYGLTASATSLSMLYLSRVATLLQHAVLAGRAIVTTNTCEKDRAKHLGYVGMCVGLGMSSGPMIGGLMSDVSLQFSAWMATAGSVLSFVTVLFFVPSDTPQQKHEATSIPAHNTNQEKPSLEGKGSNSVTMWKRGTLGLGQFQEVLASPGVANLMAIKIITNMASALFQSMFTIILKHQGLGPKHVGAAMSFVGMISIFVQAFMVGPLISKWGESQTLYYSCWGLLAGFLMLAVAKGFILTMVALVPQCVAGILLGAVSTARLTKAVPKARTGTALSLDMGMWSAIRMAAPVMGAWLFASVGAHGIGAASALLIALLLGALQVGLLTC